INGSARPLTLTERSMITDHHFTPYPPVADNEPEPPEQEAAWPAAGIDASLVPPPASVLPASVLPAPSLPSEPTPRPIRPPLPAAPITSSPPTSSEAAGTPTSPPP